MAPECSQWSVKEHELPLKVGSAVDTTVRNQCFCAMACPFSALASGSPFGTGKPSLFHYFIIFVRHSILGVDSYDACAMMPVLSRHP